MRFLRLIVLVVLVRATAVPSTLTEMLSLVFTCACLGAAPVFYMCFPCQPCDDTKEEKAKKVSNVDIAIMIWASVSMFPLILSPGISFATIITRWCNGRNAPTGHGAVLNTKDDEK